MTSLDQIRAGLSIHLQLTSLALERLQLNHRLIRYEWLVAQPEASPRGCLNAMHPRIPITLSHSQAREPIYSTSLASRASRALRSWRMRASSCSRLAGSGVSSGE